MKQLISFFLVLLPMAMFAQNVNIDYEAWNPSGTTCSLFVNPTNVPATGNISGTIEHQRKLGQIEYNNSDLSIRMQTTYQTVGAVLKGARYRISYNFKIGYSYTIYVTAAALENTIGFATGPFIRLDVNNNGGGGSTGCNGPETLSASASGNPAAVKLSSDIFQEFQFIFPSLGTQPTLEISAFPATDGGTKTVRVKKIRIVETPPAGNFTLTPSSLAVQRGTSTSQTFTVNNINSTPGVTGYTWNIGTTPNGWVYNGSAAPAIINTSTNTLSLSSVACANTISNISAIAIIGTTSYPTNSCLVSLSEPSYIINGSNLQCTATTQTYSLNTNPCNNNVIWSVNNSMVTLIPNGSSVDVSTNTLNGGSFSLTANITGVNGTVTISKQISVGPPPPITNIQTTYSRFKCNVIKYIFTVIGAESATNYQWYYRNITKGTGFTLFKNSSANFANSPVNDGSCDQIEIRVDATNACSITPVQYLFPSDLCPPFVDGSCTPTTALTISPNPSTGNIHLKLVDQPNVIPANTHEKKIMTIRIVDKMGQIKKTFNGNGFDEMTIDLSSLPTDIYTILVFNGKEWISKQINKN